MLARQLHVGAMQLTLCATLLCACASDQGIVRRRGSIEQAGRHIPAAAYAWYNRGLYHERKKDLVRADEAFSQTIKYDRKSGAAWAALARIRCKSGVDPGFSTIEKGLATALRYAPLYIERGRCRLRSESPNSQLFALADGEVALALEPDNREATDLIVQALRALGRFEDAERFALAGEIRWSLPAAFPSPDQLAAVDEALRDHDLPTARRLALTLFTPGHLALRAYVWNVPRLAREQAELVKGASPDDADATITLALLEPERPLDPSRLNDPSDLGLLLMTNHLRRTFGPELAKEFARGYQLNPHPTDPLVILLAPSLGPEPIVRPPSVSF